MIAAMHKAITVIQFKLEGQLIKRHPEYQMEDRNLLERIEYQKYNVIIEGKRYHLNDKCFSTILQDDPNKLTTEEEDLN